MYVKHSYISNSLQINAISLGCMTILWITSRALPFCQEGLSGSKNFITSDRNISVSVVNKSEKNNIRDLTKIIKKLVLKFVNPIIFPFWLFFTSFHNSYLPQKCLKFMILFIKFIYSEKATKFCEFSTVVSCTVTVKSTAEISQNFVAFSEHNDLI